MAISFSRILPIILLLITLTLHPHQASASSFSPPPLFCKCTCGSNSTIIPLDERPPPPSVPADSDLRRLVNRYWKPARSSNSNSNSNLFEDFEDASLFQLSRRDGSGEGGGGGGGGKKGSQRTCADCTRSFCLGYNLPFCKSVQKEEEVVTSCFARDSVMDRVLVWGFVVVTVGLLVWAGVRGWVLERVRGVRLGLGGRGRGYEGLGWGTGRR